MRKWGYFFCFFFWGVLASSLYAFDKQGLRLKTLQKDLDEILTSRTVRSAQVGVYAVSLREEDGIIYAKNQEKSFIPASCMKLFTTAAALDTLGCNFTFKTNIYQKGTVDAQGVLHGDLIIQRISR